MMFASLAGFDSITFWLAHNSGLFADILESKYHGNVVAACGSPWIPLGELSAEMGISHQKGDEEKG